MALPNRVHDFNGRGSAGNTGGSAHPEDIGPGRDGKPPGSAPAASFPDAAGSKSSLPKGVKQRDGTDNMKAMPKRFQSGPKPAASGSDSRIPSGVHKNSGLSAG